MEAQPEQSNPRFFVDGVLARFRIFHDQPARGPCAKLRPLPLRVAVIASESGAFEEPSSGIGPFRLEALECRTISHSHSPTPFSFPAT